MSLEETADVRETTVGAVKAAVHGGRARLRDDEAGSIPTSPGRTFPSRAIVDQFAACQQARDKAGLPALALDNAPAENVDCSYQ